MEWSTTLEKQKKWGKNKSRDVEKKKGNSKSFRKEIKPFNLLIRGSKATFWSLRFNTQCLTSFNGIKVFLPSIQTNWSELTKAFVSFIKYKEGLLAYRYWFVWILRSYRAVYLTLLCLFCKVYQLFAKILNWSFKTYCSKVFELRNCYRLDDNIQNKR